MGMSKARTALALLIAGVLVIAVLGGCTTPPATPTGTGGTTSSVLKIGVETGLTGPLPDYGFTAAEGAKLAAKGLNDKGGVTIGGKNYTIEIVVKDDEADPAKAPVVAQGFIDEGVVGVVGPLTSGAANAGGPIYSGAKMPQITASATLATLTQNGWTNFFRNCVGDNIQGAGLAKWAQDLGFKKVAVMDDSSAYAVGLADNVTKGLTVESLRQSAKDTDTDFSAQITNIKNFGADAIIFTGYHKQAGLLRKQMVEQGLGKVQMFGGDGVKSADFAAEAGGAANAKGVYCTIGAFGTANPAELPLYAKFKTDYVAQAGKDPGPYAEGNYDAVGTLVAAMEAAGSTDGAAVVTALHNLTYTGILGTYKFDANGDITAAGASANIKTIFHFINDGKDFVPTTK